MKTTDAAEKNSARRIAGVEVLPLAVRELA
jgi:hypothetical protein